MKTMEKKGFTLIELLIVIAIIGILAVAFLPSLLGAPAKGRDAQRMATIQKIENFIVTEMLAGGLHTNVVSDCISVDAAATPPTSIGSLINTNIASFGGVFPTDPQVDNPTTGAMAAACTGGEYGFIKFTDSASPYTAAVYARVEEESNANIPCLLIQDDPAIALAPVDVATGDVPCYLSLIQ